MPLAAGLLLLTLAPFGRLPAPAPRPEISATVVISQVYGGGGNTGAPYQNDFIELFNRGEVPTPLAGWSVQYASAAGAAWQVTPLPAVTLAPGQALLVQQGGGAGAGLPLPTPDVTGTTALAATAGKVALVNGQEALDGACPPGDAVVDFVGYGASVSCAEGSPAPAPSNTTALARAASGCADADDNALDFAVQAPAPRNTTWPVIVCEANLVLEAAGPPAVPPGAGLAYHVSLRNTGAAAAPAASLTATLPTHAAWVTYTASLPLNLTQLSAQQWLWEAGLLPGSTGVLTLTLHGLLEPGLSLGQWLTTTLSAATAAPEATLDDNGAAAVTLVGQPNLALTKTGPGTLPLGGAAVFTLTYANAGDLPLEATLVDQLPAGLDYASDSAGGLRAGQVITWPLGPLGVGTSGSVVLTATTAAAGLFTNTASLTGSLPETDPQDNAAAWPFTVVSPDPCQVPYLPISAIQGPTATTPYLGQVVRTAGLVTGDFQGAAALNGYFIQAEAGDGDAATSDGVFVLSNSPAVSLGQRVILTATATERNGQTELAAVAGLNLCAPGLAISPTGLTLPVTAGGDHERYEGMWVTLPASLTASDVALLGRLGQVTLSAAGRLHASTNGSDPTASAGANEARTLVLDDGSQRHNPDPVPYLDLSTGETLRAGDVVSGLTGLLDYGLIHPDSGQRFYRLHLSAPVTFTRANPRPPIPPASPAEVRVAGFNVFNYFNGDGQGGGFPTSRGAATPEAFARQRAKLIGALAALDADVVGLVEIENDGAGSLSALQDLVNGLNAATFPGAYALVTEPAPGADAIKVALIYQPGRVTPVGPAANDQVTHPAYGPVFDRPPLAQTFRVNAGGAIFGVIVNHFKSKSGCPASGPDADPGDGQGCWNAKRTAQAAALLDFVAARQAASGDPDILVLGDLNAYGQEDPLLILAAGGLADQAALRVPAPERYSYVFEGAAGLLDYALTSPSLSAHVAGLTVWHINADEPAVLGYASDHPGSYYAPDPYRSSDHDPVLLSLALPASSRVFLPLLWRP
jgi:predicted extracellular nuclease